MADNIFKLRKHREAPKTVSGTLDNVHQTIVKDIRENDKNATITKIKTLEENIRKLESSSKLEDIIAVSRLRCEIADLVESQSTNQLDSYFLKNADIMLKYYSGSLPTPSGSSASSVETENTFLKYLTNTGAVGAVIQSAGALAGAGKKQLFDEFTVRMKINTGNDSGVIAGNKPTEHCDKCNLAREEMGEEGILVCPKCGSEEYLLVVSDYPSFRDPPKERNNYAYKKINHLNEILNQFQAKESTIIPDDVFNEVICEIKKRRIQNIAEITEKDMREMLKKLGRSKYYEHSTHIISRLNGNPPPTITPEIEEKIRTMFQEIQAPFLLYCPDDRTNFLSYSYILYKFFELLELDEYKVYFPLLKSRDRLIAHDTIWQKICTYLRWEFIQSV